MPRASRTISTNIVPSKDNAHGFTLNLFPSPWRNPKRRARVDQQLVREAIDNRSVSCVFISDQGEFTGILAGISAEQTRPDPVLDVLLRRILAQGRKAWLVFDKRDDAENYREELHRGDTKARLVCEAVSPPNADLAT